ncbi:MAG: NADH-quinone oxidoreductase subunit M, partial [Planctomycetota bacterium]
YFLWAFQRVFLGPLNEKYRTMPDASPREMFTLVPLGVLVIVFGVFPGLLITPMNVALDTLVGMLKG